MWSECGLAQETHRAGSTVFISLHDEFSSREFPGSGSFQEDHPDKPDIGRVGVDEEHADGSALPVSGVEIVDLERWIAAPGILDEADIPSSTAAGR